MLLEPTLNVDGRHTPASGGRDGLAVPTIGKVTRREHPIDARGGRAGLGDDVALRVQHDLLPQEVRIGGVPDGNENTGYGQHALGPALDVAQL